MLLPLSARRDDTKSVAAAAAAAAVAVIVQDGVDAVYEIALRWYRRRCYPSTDQNAVAKSCPIWKASCLAT